ncbi:homeobox protein TGIF2LX-like [Artemia franciscana]|uniref:Homeobox domain-containing protein n=1 Tax=Artemia franciscana TaxID=6661 RepID=A0AA88HE62_ARTSF|nr:hypothetical protein QYM36_014299 [Artemia franciscana]
MNYLDTEPLCSNSSNSSNSQYFSFEEYPEETQRKRCLTKEGLELLKQWLSEHIYDPYPTELEKKSLAQLSGLSMLQINCWFMEVQEHRQTSTLFNLSNTTGESSPYNSYYESLATSNYEVPTTNYYESPTKTNYVESQMEPSYSQGNPNGYAFIESNVPRENFETRLGQCEGQCRCRGATELEAIFNQPYIADESSSYSSYYETSATSYSTSTTSWSPVTDSIPTSNVYALPTTNYVEPQIDPSYSLYDSRYPSSGFRVPQENLEPRISPPLIPPDELLNYNFISH